MRNEIQADDFARRFSLRAPKLMWFLGAGTSASAGLPTALDLIGEFKRALFLSQNPRSSQAFRNLPQSTVSNLVDAHIKTLEGMPTPGAANEYARLFEAAYPAESDRRTILDDKLAGAKPSYGHMALATLMRSGLTRMVWTTNFDTLVADACAKVFDTTSALASIDLDSTELAQETISNERWPMEVKLHGDFRSRQLKNTAKELREQDALLRRALIDSCRGNGLIVCGYSGRDDSVMEALEEAAKHPGAFPAGLFWLHRGDGAPLARVTQLLDLGAANGVEVAVVSVESFDEVLRDLIHFSKDIDASALERFAQRKRWSPAPLQSTPKGGWPVIRLNALPVVDRPTQCRRLACNIGNTAEVRKTIQETGVDVLAVRSRIGVLAFGADADIREAFESHRISDFDLHPFDAKRQRYESSERGLLSEALNHAIARDRGLNLVQRRRLAPKDPADTIWDPLRGLVGPLSGVAEADPQLSWLEGLAVRLDWANDRLWLLFDPCTVFVGVNDDNKKVAADLARERTVRRYNRVLNDLVDFWARHLSHGGNLMRAFDTGTGVDAVFRLASNTGFSRRT